MGKIRGTHSSPGVYTQITDLSYAAKTLGITTLGLVGETLKGPAFEPIAISNYNQFKEYFGGTSTAKFAGSQYPKYEAPYIAKSYLSASDQMYMCRVLGLSGYNAGPAFVITAKGDGDKNYVVAVLRSRGTYKKYANIGNECNPISAYDTLEFDCDSIELVPYTNLSVVRSGCDVTSSISAETSISISAINLGQFSIKCKKGTEELCTIPVSLNAGAKDYIYDVIGSKASKDSEFSYPVFVEEFYDVMLADLVGSGKVDEINSTVTTIREVVINSVSEPVNDYVNVPASSLSKRYVGSAFICKTSGSTGDTGNGYVYHAYDGDNGTYAEAESCMEVGGIYTVKKIITSDNIKKYVYVNVVDNSGNTVSVGEKLSGATTFDTVNAVKVLSDDVFVCLEDDELVALSTMSDYHEKFRCASTPWIVSELIGDAAHIEVKKLFRFHTISDGNNANEQVKISIANVRPDDGTFDVYVRAFDDSDSSPVFLETYKGLTMVPGDSKYIGLKIGTVDGAYEAISKYVLVEVIENEMTETCVPCGFLGYPVRNYGNNLVAPSFSYNKMWDEDIADKRQYFGLSDLNGVDVDMLYYKGKDAYTENYTVGYTNGFHLDSSLSSELDTSTGITVTLDGAVSGLTWETVSPRAKKNVTDGSPIIGSEEEMEGTLYENVALRKFTVYPYGGFDGWDPYRTSRTNTDEFKANKYKGTITNGNGKTFSRVSDGVALGLTGNSITSDYYAYLAGALQFEDPERFIINLIATPGIDYVNNNLLSKEILTMVSEKRLDSIYVMTTPDKPMGASDDVDEMFTSKDAAANLEDANIDTYYAATYYPWVKFFDSEDNRYINLPATKDVLRNMADVDNKKYPWYAPAGLERGNVECKKLHFASKIEDEDNVYDGRINPLKAFSQDGIKVWGNKSMYKGDTPMNRINVVRLVLYMRKLVVDSTRGLIFEPNDTTLKNEFRSIVEPILAQIQADRGITEYRLDISQTAEEMDAHELSCKLWIKPTPTLEYIEINFMVTPQGVEFED